MMTRSLTFLGAHATRFLFVAPLVGVLLACLARLMRPLLTAAVAVVPSISIMRIEGSGIFLFIAVAQPPIFMLPANGREMRPLTQS